MNQELIDIIKRVKEKISDDSDMVWTTYEDAGQLRTKLEACIEKLKVGDNTCLEQMRLLFLPTANLQEHSIVNGWPDEYLALAEKFDHLYSTIKNRS